MAPPTPTTRPPEQPETLFTRNPDGTTSGTRIRADRYTLFAEHILDIVPADERGIPLADLRRELARRLEDHTFDARGSVTWYTMAVKLDLEGRGRIERVPGRGPQRLRAVGR